MNDTFYMQLALNEAWKYQLLTYPNPAVGAVIVLNGKILAIEAHQKAGTSHAEVLALLKSYEKLSKIKLNFDCYNAIKAHAFLLSLPLTFFSECEIFVTLEPCSHIGKTPSCASLLQKLALKRVIIGIEDKIKGHDGGLKKLSTITLGVLKKECESLLEPFMIWQKRAFVLFKLAQTSNGKIGGGYLSSQDSLTHVHQIREVCDALLIGGNTVREDRPTLDCRFTHTNAPNIKIYSKNNDFDQTIPLFGIKNREVEIVNDLNFLKMPSFVLVEGGEGMLNALKKHIDWLLIYQTPKLSSHNLTYNTAINLKFLHQNKKGVDLIIWSRKIDK